jgi:hypothetical protein
VIVIVDILHLDLRQLYLLQDVIILLWIIVLHLIDILDLLLL